MVTKIGEAELRGVKSGEIKARMQEQKANRDFLRTHYQDLLEKYRNHWVVISGGQLAEVEDDPDKLVKVLNDTRESNMLVFYLADPEDFMLL
jgi:thymidylate kinase